jgi:hypothetical protein
MVKLWAIVLAVAGFVVILDVVIIGDSYPNPTNYYAPQS